MTTPTHARRTTPRWRGRTATALVALLVGMLALAGCGGDGARDLGTLAQHKVDFTPEPTGALDSIVWNVFQGEPQTIDPFRSADYTPNMINSNLCENLLVQRPGQEEIEPNLASRFSNPDPRTWVYTLRKDVTFWDGSPMTAEDVAFSLHQQLTDAKSFNHYLFASVDSVEITGKHEVTVHLKKPDYMFNSELANFAGVVVQKKFYQEHKKTFGSADTGVMCTGPYKFVDWEQAQKIRVERYDGYWNKRLRPKVRRIDFTFLTDESSITAALMSGEIDGTYQPPVSALAQLNAGDAGKLAIGPAPVMTTAVYADPKGPMSDKGMRRALQLAIDWKGIGKTVFATTAEPGKIAMPEAVWGLAHKELSKYTAPLPKVAEPDYAAAKKILTQVPERVRDQEITFVVPDSPTTKSFGLAYKDAADRIGLNFHLLVVPTTGYTNYLYDPETRKGIDLLYTEFWPNVNDPVDWIQTTAVTGALFNQYGYDGVDKLYAKAIGSADKAERAKLVVEMEKKIHGGLMPMMPGVEASTVVFQNNRLTGAPAAFGYVYYPWAAHLGGTGEK
ncbi:ABC transporter substrate-binding protein [Streptomyces endophyticus]|uniref:ABC transporter substrate-binding protein n=1 Tax=Streptomyces endophyticus TaxID=714166 RepID=A0ABU6F9P4_9ACTN|nr:ABC transporter substrate-binding protein [Streptomyces endophyticus]MEB8340760.1 ABC transporter substrate-binding protein [Streptomyces endophyticus]